MKKYCATYSWSADNDNIAGFGNCYCELENKNMECIEELENKIIQSSINQGYRDYHAIILNLIELDD